MTFGQFFSILRAHWKVVFLIAAVTIAAAVVGSLLLPKKYTATASVVIDMNPDPVVGVQLPERQLAAYIATQVDILKSDRVARRVVQTLKMTDSARARERWQELTGGQGDFEYWVVESMRLNVEVKPSRESSVIEVSYKSEDPVAAARVANTIVQAYIDTNLDLRVDPAKRYSTFFDARAKQLRDAVEAAQSKLSAYQRSRGIIAGGDRLDVESARLNELSAQIVALQSLSVESSSRQSQSAGSVDQLQDALNSPVIAGLRADLSRQEARLQEMNSRLGDNHPQVIELKASIAESRSRLATETRRIAGGIGLTSRINQQRLAEVRALYEAQRAKVLRMRDQHDEVAVLQRELESSQRAYDAVLTRYNQSSLESQNTQTNISVLNRANQPILPSSPNVVLNAILATILGIGLGIGAAMALELMNRKVRSVDDVVQALGLPVIGILPLPDRRRFGGDRQPLLVRRILGQLPAPTSKSA